MHPKKRIPIRRPREPRREAIPDYLPVTEDAENLRFPPGDLTTETLHYPKTILRSLTTAQKDKWDHIVATFAGGMHPRDEDTVAALRTPAPLHAEGASFLGCTRHVYDASRRTDGRQLRWEPDDDVSFDVKNAQCPSCELYRRLVELTPVIYEVPEEGEIPNPPTEGYLPGEQWEIITVPDDPSFTTETADGVKYWNLSRATMLSVLVPALSHAAGGRGYPQFRSVLGGSVCGGQRVFVARKKPEDGEGARDDEELDFERGVLQALTTLESTFVEGGVSFTLTLSEFSPNESDGDVYHGDGGIVLDPLSPTLLSSLTLVVRSKSIGDHVLRTRPAHTPAIPMRHLMSSSTIPDSDYCYPDIFAGRQGWGALITYCLVFLMEKKENGGEVERTIADSPEQFFYYGEKVMSHEELEELRSRLLFLKRTSYPHSFYPTLKLLRRNLQGLRMKM